MSGAVAFDVAMLLGLTVAAVSVADFLVWRRRRRARDAEFVRQAFEFARERGGLPCKDCILSHMAGWCTHREPLPLPQAKAVKS